MASHDDDNKPKLNANVNIEQEKNLIDVKKYDAILNSKDVKFDIKVQNLIEVWQKISELNLKDFESIYVLQIIDWAKLQALNIVLMGEWRQTKEEDHDALLEAIKKAQNNLNTRNKNFGARCQKLLDVVKKPWEDPILNTLLNSKDTEIGPQEIEFFCVETAYLISVRLKKLCENHCEDLALNLTSNFLKCNKLSKEQNFTLSANETQVWYIVDTHVALLYKFHDKASIIRQFEELELKEGVELIKRFSKKRVQISKVWKHCHKIAMFGARFFLSKALMSYSFNTRPLLIDLMKVYIHLSNTDTLTDEFIGSVRSITNLADAAGLCALCEVIHQEAGEKLRHFAIEMYIRALTTDMNELERLKHQSEHEKVDSTTSRLATSFINLSELLDTHVNVARECVLTGFSLEPTKERLKKIEDLAKRSGFEILDTGQEWKCKLHPPVLPTDDLAWECSECGDYMCKPALTASIQTNFALNEALQPCALGISQALCDDLVVCLSNPRYQVLSWLLEWNDLYRLCIMYLNDPEKTKNFVTELKFVDIDYSQFQHIKKEPVDEYTGIEKGYEQYLDLDFVSDEEYSGSEQSQDSQYSSSKTFEDSLSSILPKKSESDPTTLKSLRMFRPNLKRKNQDSEPQTSELKKIKLPTPGLTDSNANNAYAVNKSQVIVSTSTTTNTSTVSSGVTSVVPKTQTCTKPSVDYITTTSHTVNKTDLYGSQYISNVNKNSSIKTYSSSNLNKKVTTPLPSAAAARNYEADLLRNFADTVNSNYKSYPTHQTSQTSTSKRHSVTTSLTGTFQRKNFNTIDASDLFDNFIKELSSSKTTPKPSETQQHSTITKAITDSKNVEAATLLRLGGQLVAQKLHQPIQVALLPNREPICSTRKIQGKSFRMSTQKATTEDQLLTKKRSRSLENSNSPKARVTRSRTSERDSKSCNLEFLRGLVLSQTPLCRQLQVRIMPIPSVQMERLLQSKQTPTAISRQQNTRTLQPLQEYLPQKQMDQELVVRLERLSPKTKDLEPKCPITRLKSLQILLPTQLSTKSPTRAQPKVISPERKLPNLIVQLERLLYSEQPRKRNIPPQTELAYSLRQMNPRACRQISQVQKSVQYSLKEDITSQSPQAQQEHLPPPPETSLLYQTEKEVCARLLLQTAKNKQLFSMALVQQDSSHMPAQTVQTVTAQRHLPLHSNHCLPQTTPQPTATKIINTVERPILSPAKELSAHLQTAGLLCQDLESNMELSTPPLPPITLDKIIPLMPLASQETLSSEESPLQLLPLTLGNSNSQEILPDKSMSPIQDQPVILDNLVHPKMPIVNNPVSPLHLRQYHCQNIVLPSVLDQPEEARLFRQEPQMKGMCNTTQPSPMETDILTLAIPITAKLPQQPLEDTQITTRVFRKSEQINKMSTQQFALVNKPQSLLKRQNPTSYDLVSPPSCSTIALSSMETCLGLTKRTTVIPLQTLLKTAQTLFGKTIVDLLSRAVQVESTLKDQRLVMLPRTQRPTERCYITEVQTSRQLQLVSLNPILQCLLFPYQNQAIAINPVKMILLKSCVENLLSGTLSINTLLVKKVNMLSNCQMKNGNSTLMKTLEQGDPCPLGGDSDSSLFEETSYSDRIDTDDDIIDGFSDSESDCEGIQNICQGLCSKLYNDLLDNENNIDESRVNISLDAAPLDLTVVALDLASHSISNKDSEKINNKASVLTSTARKPNNITVKRCNFSKTVVNEYIPQPDDNQSFDDHNLSDKETKSNNIADVILKPLYIKESTKNQVDLENNNWSDPFDTKIKSEEEDESETSSTEELTIDRIMLMFSNARHLNGAGEFDDNSKSIDSGLSLNEEIKDEYCSSGDCLSFETSDTDSSMSGFSDNLLPKRCKNIYLQTDNGNDLQRLCKNLGKDLAGEYISEDIKEIQRATDAMKPRKVDYNRTKLNRLKEPKNLKSKKHNGDDLYKLYKHLEKELAREYIGEDIREIQRATDAMKPVKPSGLGEPKNLKSSEFVQLASDKQNKSIQEIVTEYFNNSKLSQKEIQKSYLDEPKILTIPKVVELASDKEHFALAKETAEKYFFLRGKQIGIKEERLDSPCNNECDIEISSNLQNPADIPTEASSISVTNNRENLANTDDFKINDIPIEISSDLQTPADIPNEASSISVKNNLEDLGNTDDFKLTNDIPTETRRYTSIENYIDDFVKPERRIVNFLKWRVRRKRERMYRKIKSRHSKIYSSIQTGFDYDNHSKDLSLTDVCNSKTLFSDSDIKIELVKEKSPHLFEDYNDLYYNTSTESIKAEDVSAEDESNLNLNEDKRNMLFYDTSLDEATDFQKENIDLNSIDENCTLDEKETLGLCGNDDDVKSEMVVCNDATEMTNWECAISSSDNEEKTEISCGNDFEVQMDNIVETLESSSHDIAKQIACKIHHLEKALSLNKIKNCDDYDSIYSNPLNLCGDIVANKFERLFGKSDDWMSYLNTYDILDTDQTDTRKRKSKFVLYLSSDSEEEELQRNFLDLPLDDCKTKTKKVVPTMRKKKQRQAKSKEAREKYLDKYKLPGSSAEQIKRDKHKRLALDNLKSSIKNTSNNTESKHLADKPYACFDVSDRIKEVKMDIPTRPLVNFHKYLKNRKAGEPLPTSDECLEYLTDQRVVNSVLRNVPGLYDLDFLTPRHIEHIVNVAQVSGTRAQNVTTHNSQTSTQVTPHIQRIGQPVTRVIEHKPPDASTTQTSTSATISNATLKPVSTQPSTLINILSQQIRPVHNLVRGTRPPVGPLINILSQQIIRPGPVGIQLPQVQKVVISSNSQAADLLQASVIKSDTKTDSTVVSTITTTKPVIAIANSTSHVSTSTASSGQGGTILQFICKSSLPKFQQAFGKCVSYQKPANTVTTETVTPAQVVTPVVVAPSTVEANTASANSTSTVTATLTPVAPLTVETKKIVSTKTVPINVQPLTANVIYRGQVPVGQTISLIPPGSTTRQLFRITGTTNDQMTLVKETVIQNKMHALLAAALQAKPKNAQDTNGQADNVPPTRITLCKPNMPGVVPNARIVRPVQVQIPTGATVRTQQSNNTTNVSSTTLEQLREFDMVYKQVKERSSTSSTTSEATNSPVDTQDSPPQPNPQPQRISFAYVQNPVQKFAQLSPVVVVSSYNHLQAATSVSPALTVISQGNVTTATTQAATCTLPKIASKSSKSKSSKSTTASSINNMIKAAAAIPKAPPKPQEDEQTTQRIFDILAEYAEQLRNSPDLNNKPAPRRRSNPPTNPSSGSKRRKSSTSKKPGTNSSVETDTDDWTMGSEDSSNGNVLPLSATDDEQSQQAVSLSTPTEPPTSQPSVQTEFKQEIPQTTSLQSIPTTSTPVTSTVNPRPFIFADPNQQANMTPSRNVIITDGSVGEALKIPNTALIVPGSYIVPVSMVKGAQQIVQIAGGNKILTTVPTRPGQNMLVFQGFVNQNRKVGLQAVKYSTIQPLTNIATPNMTIQHPQQQVVFPQNVVALGQPLTLKKIENGGHKTGNEFYLTISQPRETTTFNKVIDKVSPDVPQPDSSTNLSSEPVEIKIEDMGEGDSNSTVKIITDFPKTSAVATSVIASCIKEEIIDHNTPVDIITDDNIQMGEPDNEIKVQQPRKPEERIKSVLVNTSSNGPMLSHTNSRYRKRSESAETIISSSSHNGEKVSTSEPKIYNTKSYFRAKKHVHTVNKKLESEMQKQAALERELRLQKSLSEECEDLGVDEPSTSDLFPEADLLFDQNHSPAYEHTEIKKSQATTVSKTDKAGNMIFSDDENSGPLQADALFDYVEYPVGQTTEYPPQLLNGNNETVSSCDDNNLLNNMTPTQEVTLNSPVTGDVYTDTQPTNKYKYKYSNRKKNEKNSIISDKLDVPNKDLDHHTKTTLDIPSELDSAIITTTTVVSRVEPSHKESADSKCQIHCNKADEDPKRGSRRSLKKPCACCNGSKSPPAVTLPKKRPLTPSKSPKRILPNKKR